MRRFRIPERREIVHIFAAHADYHSLRDRILSITNFIKEIPDQDDVILDLMAWSPEPLGDADSISQEIRQVLRQISLPRAIGRIVMAVSGPGKGPGAGACSISLMRLAQRATKKFVYSAEFIP